MVEEGLVALLQANNGGDAIDTYVTPAGGIFGDDAPPDLASMPCITYTFVGGSSNPTSNTSGVLRQRVELNAQVVNPVGSLSPRAIAGKIRQAIILRVNGWRENNVGGDGTNVLTAVLLNPGTDFVTEERIFRMMCEFYVLYALPSAA